jgi:hypothetical protein
MANPIFWNGTALGGLRMAGDPGRNPASAAPTKALAQGSFRIADMSGCPATTSARPDQALRLISGHEYSAARSLPITSIKG